MSYVGKWKFHSIGTISDDDKWVFYNAEEYLKSPMPYVDETDEEAVADEMKERKQMIGSKLDVCEDGKFFTLMPLPEGVGDDEVKAAAEAGIITLRDGMLTDGTPYTWEDRNGEFWAEIPGCGEISRLDDGEGKIAFMTTRYVKE